MSIALPPFAAETSIAPRLPQESDDLRTVAEGFEAIIVRRILETARAADLGGDDLFGGQGMETFTAMRDEHVAELVARSGTLGFAASIEQQLAARLPGVGK